MSIYRFIEAERARYSITRLCSALGVSRSGFYAWAARGPSARAVEDQRLIALIRQIHADSRGTYGAPRIRAELAGAHQIHIATKRVARLMRAEGLCGAHRRRFRSRAAGRPERRPAPDRVQRAFGAPAPDAL